MRVWLWGRGQKECFRQTPPTRTHTRTHAFRQDSDLVIRFAFWKGPGGAGPREGGLRLDEREPVGAQAPLLST